MGEAKRRGTASERRAEALGKGGDVLGLIRSGDAPHYAFVLDRSEVGLGILKAMRHGPDELRARANSAAVALWEQTPHFQYVVIWGSWGYSGGLTLPTANIEFLLAESLPAATKRTQEKGGLCTFIPGVAAEVRDAILVRIAELQPVSGPIQ